VKHESSNVNAYSQLTFDWARQALTTYKLKRHILLNIPLVSNKHSYENVNTTSHDISVKTGIPLL